MDESAPRWAGRRVVIISHDYAPDLVGIAPYATETATWFAAQGAQVDVLSMPPHYPGWKVPAGVPRGYHRETIDGVTVWRLPTYVPSRPTLMRRLVFEGSWLLAAAPLLGHRVVRRADLVVGISPGIFAGVFAAVAAGRRPLLQIVQDLVGQAATQSGMSGAARMARALGTLEAWALRRARAVSVPAPGFIAPLEDLGIDPSRIDVVPNWSRVPAPAETDAESAAAGDAFTVMHAGNMGLKQGLDLLGPVMEAAETRDAGVRFRFLGEGSQADALRSTIADRTNAEILPYVAEEDLAETLRSAQALLVHERPTVKDMSLPSKLTTYFAMGRPIIAVVRDDGSTAAEIRRSGGGLVVTPGDPHAFLDAVTRLRDEPGLAEELASRGRAHSRENLSREVSLGRLGGLVDRALDQAS